MFYSEAILSKKGPLAKVWLAAHWERKLSKNQFLQTNIHSSVDAIMGTDQAPMALRLSGQLLLGVARIYSRKTKYLLEDCNEALVKIKVAFRSDASTKGDSNLLMLDGTAADFPADHSRAAFNAITVPDAATEFDLLLPAQAIDINAWGLKPKLQQLSHAQDTTLEDRNDDDTLNIARSAFRLDHRRRHLGLDIELGRNHMGRMGGGGYSTMDFDLAGPDDALDLDMFGDDLVGTGDMDFLRRAHQRRDDLEIEVGRDAGVQRRSVSVDPFGMMANGSKQQPEGSVDGRAPSVTGFVQEPAFDEFAGVQEGTRAPLHFEIADDIERAAVIEAGAQEKAQPTIKKRKLVVDDETEMSQDLLMGMNADFLAEGLLMQHDMLPRSRKLLRLQQIEQDVAHGGLAGYLLDCSAGPRVMGGSMVPELASMFSRRLQIDQQAPAVPAEGSHWKDDQVESWADQVQDFGIHDTTPPPADIFEGFRLESPQKDRTTEIEAAGIEGGEGSGLALPKTSTRSTLFQETDELNAAGTSTTKELHGAVFSHSTIQTMRLVQQGLEAHKQGDERDRTTRSTRNATTATASSALNRDNTARATFSELMAGTSTSQQKRNRTDAAKLFFELLVLSTKDVIKVEQEESFGEIKVGGSPWMDTLLEADANTADTVSVSA
ncbi:sister chromatid cohesion protein 1 [Mortierella polycephala]|uniref:Sister chromatid cohesion protein 1 n=1 Tax=Mortierella polycephala TaxID=41804 RepID=A0A9P6TZK3_9FUNG|nr:sister chromatid cohesion protein 1 [Mortierella polycephala]